MRIASDHQASSTNTARSRTASRQSDSGFGNTLASALGATGDEKTGPPPELSAATYRLFAAINLERGDTAHAARHLARVADAREAGLPVHPSGALAENGRWDYTAAAAALPETGIFESTSGQGKLRFTAYRPNDDDAAPAGAPPPRGIRGTRPATTTTNPAETDGTIDRVNRNSSRTLERRPVSQPDLTPQRIDLEAHPAPRNRRV